MLAHLYPPFFDDELLPLLLLFEYLCVMWYGVMWWCGALYRGLVLVWNRSREWGGAGRINGLIATWLLYTFWFGIKNKETKRKKKNSFSTYTTHTPRCVVSKSLSSNAFERLSWSRACGRYAKANMACHLSLLSLSLLRRQRAHGPMHLSLLLFFQNAHMYRENKAAQ